MKSLLLLCCTILMLISCSKELMETRVQEVPGIPVPAHPKADSLQKLINKFAAKGIPGISIALLDESGLWMGAAGFAKLEDQTPMKPGMLQYGFSITKMYTAVSIMQLKEKGLIDLDQPIRKYLPAEWATAVPASDVVTVRMLLNMSSGYSNYTYTNAFMLDFLDNPLAFRDRSYYRDMICRKTKQLFAPGTDYHYSNTNYYLLALIMEQVTGMPHQQWYRREIFRKAGLTQSFYKGDDGYPYFNTLPNTYYSIHGDARVQNNTRMQQAWMQNQEIGCIGVVATPADFLGFMQALVQGRLVSAASLQEMRTWITRRGGKEPDYGLGLVYFGYNGKMQFGHDGDGIGAHARLMYFPGSNSFLFLAANGSKETGGPLMQALTDLDNESASYIASF